MDYSLPPLLSHSSTESCHRNMLQHEPLPLLPAGVESAPHLRELGELPDVIAVHLGHRHDGGHRDERHQRQPPREVEHEQQGHHHHDQISVIIKYQILIRSKRGVVDCQVLVTSKRGRKKKKNARA